MRGEAGGLAELAFAFRSDATPLGTMKSQSARASGWRRTSKSARNAEPQRAPILETVNDLSTTPVATTAERANRNRNHLAAIGALERRSNPRQTAGRTGGKGRLDKPHPASNGRRRSLRRGALAAAKLAHVGVNKPQHRFQPGPCLGDQGHDGHNRRCRRRRRPQAVSGRWHPSGPRRDQRLTTGRRGAFLAGG